MRRGPPADRYQYTRYYTHFLPLQVPESDLYCSQCKNSLPYCVATGYHITPTDLTKCPECKFPASRSELLKLVEDGVVCPMCVETLATSDIKVLTPSMLRTGNEEVEEKVDEEEEEDGRPVTGSRISKS